MTTNQKTFSIVPGLNMGLFSPKELAEVVAVINKYNVPMTKITSAQRLGLLGMDEEEQARLKAELKPLTRPVPVNGVHYVQACPGSLWCKYGTSDSLALGRRLEQLSFSEPLPGKIKIGVSGCRMSCTEPYVRDVGIFATKKGWTLVFGGNGGGNPRLNWWRDACAFIRKMPSLNLVPQDLWSVSALTHSKKGSYPSLLESRPLAYLQIEDSCP